MKLLADECVYSITTELLRECGHDIVTVQKSGLSGASDDVVLAYAVAEGRILVSNDAHFSNVLLFPPQKHLGIIVLKIRPRVLDQVHTVLFSLLRRTDQSAMTQTLVIVDRNKYRVYR